MNHKYFTVFMMIFVFLLVSSFADGVHPVHGEKYLQSYGSLDRAGLTYGTQAALGQKNGSDGGHVCKKIGKSFVLLTEKTPAQQQHQIMCECGHSPFTTAADSKLGKSGNLVVLAEIDRNSNLVNLFINSENSSLRDAIGRLYTMEISPSSPITIAGKQYTSPFAIVAAIVKTQLDSSVFIQSVGKLTGRDYDMATSNFSDRSNWSPEAIQIQEITPVDGSWMSVRKSIQDTKKFSYSLLAQTPTQRNQFRATTKVGKAAQKMATLSLKVSESLKKVVVNSLSPRDITSANLVIEKFNQARNAYRNFLAQNSNVSLGFAIQK